jgi:hypothetical protein
LKQKYSNVAAKLGVGALRSASAFRSKAMVFAETETDEAVGNIQEATSVVEVTKPGTENAENTPMDDMPELAERVEETMSGTEEKATADMTTMFESHFDTHTHTATTFFLSSKDSFVYYTIDGRIVDRLHISGGLSIVVTTEILSGRKDVNPSKLKHYSESANDRTLVCVVREAPVEIQLSHLCNLRSLIICYDYVMLEETIYYIDC